MRIYKNIFNKIVDLDNLFSSWNEFRKGKIKKDDVMQFEYSLEQNIFKLYRDLINKKYKHGQYKKFWIYDPKLRQINKATVIDRVLHHAVFKVLNPIFEPTFISNSFSCRIGKGTHKGVDTVEKILREVSRNNTRNCYVLKCDIQKFFDSVDHQILLSIIRKKIKDKDTLWLLTELIESYGNSEIMRERERE